MEFQKTKVLLMGDLEFGNYTPEVRCPHNLELALGLDGNVAKFSISNTGSERTWKSVALS